MAGLGLAIFQQTIGATPIICYADQILGAPGSSAEVSPP